MNYGLIKTGPSCSSRCRVQLAIALLGLTFLPLTIAATDDVSPFCSSGREFPETCSTHLQSAPLIYVEKLSDPFSKPVRDAYYAKVCPSGKCLLSLSGLDARLRKIDYLALLSQLVAHVRSNGKSIAFSGTSAQELLITTNSEELNGQTRYYQILLESQSCQGPERGDAICSVVGGASVVTAANGQHRLSTDALCQSTEKQILGYLTSLGTK